MVRGRQQRMSRFRSTQPCAVASRASIELQKRLPRSTAVSPYDEQAPVYACAGSPVAVPEIHPEFRQRSPTLKASHRAPPAH